MISTERGSCPGGAVSGSSWIVNICQEKKSLVRALGGDSGAQTKKITRGNIFRARETFTTAREAEGEGESGYCERGNGERDERERETTAREKTSKEK
jgi:hypothetical protein